METNPRWPERVRPATPAELASIPWWSLLGPAEQRLVAAQLQVSTVEAGELLCRPGQAVSHWLGVLDGLLKRSGGPAAHAVTGLPPGAWVGEGTLLKREAYRYGVEALRRSRVAGLPLAAFEALLAQSLSFNRFLLDQLNERLGLLLAARETERSADPDRRVARHLATLFHPGLNPSGAGLLRLTQQELAALVGLSRQRVNLALQRLQEAGLVRVEYGGVRVLALPGLRDFHPAQGPGTP